MQNYSVLMSVYYKENPIYFRTAIQSMLDQTIATDDFVLVCDGKLTPQLYDVIDFYKNKYPSVFNIIQLHENKGLGNALNIGLSKCKNELVARMDSDDIAASNRVELQLQRFHNSPEVSLVGGQIAEFIGDTENVVDYRVVPLDNNAICEYMRKRNPINHMTVMFKKTHVLEAGNYKDFSYHEDYHLWSRMYKKGSLFLNLPDILVYARSGDEMFRRRGGISYFKNTYKFQCYMLKEGFIDKKRFIINVTERLIVQVIMPNKLRGSIIRLFARKKSI